jgi:hypothetical protein
MMSSKVKENKRSTTRLTLSFKATPKPRMK